MPLSKDPERRAAQVDRLRRDGAQPNNPRALQSGAWAEKSANLVFLDQTREDVYGELAAAAPIREAGALPPADHAIVEQAARAVARCRQVDNYLAEHGPLDEEGVPRPALAALERATRTAHALLVELGMTPRSRAALGVDLARGVDLAAALSEPDPELRRELLRRAGVIEGEVSGG